MLSILEELTHRYSEPHRYYHTLEHISFMFNKAKEKDIKLTRAQEIAIWFHDAIYDPTKRDNEIRSAELFENRWQHFYMLYSDVPMSEIKQIILDTRNHMPTIEASRIVLDLDLSILATNNLHEYLRYEQGIKKEYSHVSKLDWINGRTIFLKKMRDRKQIFHSMYFFGDNDMAMDNISNELEDLRAELKEF